MCSHIEKSVEMVFTENVVFEEKEGVIVGWETQNILSKNLGVVIALEYLNVAFITVNIISVGYDFSQTHIMEYEPTCPIVF